MTLFYKILCTFAARIEYQTNFNHKLIKRMTTKRNYEKPTTKVVELRQTGILMYSDGNGGGMPGGQPGQPF